MVIRKLLLDLFTCKTEIVYAIWGFCLLFSCGYFDLAETCSWKTSLGGSNSLF